MSNDPSPEPARSLEDFDFARLREIEGLERRLHFQGRNHHLLAIVDAVGWGVVGTACIAWPLWNWIHEIWKESAWVWVLFNLVLVSGIAYPAVASHRRWKITEMRQEIKRLRAGHRRLVKRFRGKTGGR